MTRWLRRLGVALFAIFGLLGLAIAIVVVVSKRREGKAYVVPPSEIEIPTDSAVFAEGRRLFQARGCADCHGEDAGGKLIFDAPPARVVGSNLTAIANGFSGSDWSRAVRNGVSPAGRPYMFMPAHEMHRMSDQELGAIVAYVRTMPRVDRAMQPSEVRLLGRFLHVIDAMPLFPAEKIDQTVPLPPPPRAGTLEFGEYLAQGCTGCHGAHFSGGPIPGAPESVVGIPPNLTPHEKSDVSHWSEADFRTLMRLGRRPNGTDVNAKFMPWKAFSAMTDQELTDLWGYLRQLPPREFGHR